MKQETTIIVAMTIVWLVMLKNARTVASLMKDADAAVMSGKLEDK